MAPEFSASGLIYEVDTISGMTCAICRLSGKSLMHRKGTRDFGICEPCAGIATWAWRQIAGEVLSDKMALAQISRVYALVVRRRWIPRADVPDDPNESRFILAPAELDSSYEFLFVETSEGGLDLPSVSGLSVWGATDPSIAVLRALADVGIVSWSPLCEPLYTSYSPRGKLVQVVLVRGWGERDGIGDVSGSRCWLPWPVSAHAGGGMAGFWKSLESVWNLRLYRHCSRQETEELCVFLRKAAMEYVVLQEEIRAGRTVDSSMLPSLQIGMTVDEVAITRMIRLYHERKDREKALVAQPIDRLRSAAARAKQVEVEIAADPLHESGEEDEWPELGIETVQTGTEGGESGEDGEGSFVRPKLRGPEK